VKKFILSFIAVIFFAAGSLAEFGIWASAIYLNVNGSQQFYNTQKNTSPLAIGTINFGGNLGVFGLNSGMLRVDGAEIKASVSNGANICGAKIFYTTYLQGSRPASPLFTELTLEHYCDCTGTGFNGCGGGNCISTGDQKWQKVGYSNDLTNSMAGDYTLEIYYSLNGNPTGAGCSQTRMDNNNNNNYTANYTILGVAALNFSGISASEYDNNIKVRWGVQSDLDIAKYEVQKSENGLIFTTMATVNSNKTTGQNLYFVIDNNPLIGSNYYRVKIIFDNNTVSISKVIRVYFGRVNNSLFIYPNPTGSELTIRFAAVAKGNYQMSVFNNNGQRITTQPILHDGVDKTIKINLPSNLSRGIYRLFMIDKVEFYKQAFIIK
jgi:hypothetical protein